MRAVPSFPSHQDQMVRFNGITIRRIAFAIVVVLSIVLLIGLMAATLSPGGLSIPEIILLICFAVTLPWTVIGFWNALIGLVIMRFSRDPSAFVCPALDKVDNSAPIETSTALLVCIRNEAAETVYRNVAAMADGLIQSGFADRFHIYVLSDSNFADAIEAEEAGFSELERQFGGRIELTYRRRDDNPGFKAGNIRDFCDRWGRNHDFMLTLDADSFMTTEAILRLVRLMQADDRIGIAQSLVTGLPSASPFARIFQFGMRHGMRSYTIGSAWWQGDCGPYWGHNAILRLEPFMEHCHLPQLPGRGVLSGYILSHDQVEAVLMRRAGYEARVVPVDGGSWEENPTSLPEFIRRDLRWCQGNMQYFWLVGLPGLKLVSRFQLMLAILMFLGAPAWITFIVVVSTLYLFAADPANMFDPVSGAAVFATVMTMVFAPKLASLVDTILDPVRRRSYGGFIRLMASAVVEIVFSMLLAPIMALVQTVFLGGLPLGRKIGWPSQQRSLHTVSLGTAVKRLWMPTVFGAVSMAWLYNGFTMATLVALPVFLGPLIAIPLAIVTTWSPLGRFLIMTGLVPVPEENTRPPALVSLELEAMVPAQNTVQDLSDTVLEPVPQSANS